MKKNCFRTDFGQKRTDFTGLNQAARSANRSGGQLVPHCGGDPRQPRRTLVAPLVRAGTSPVLGNAFPGARPKVVTKRAKKGQIVPNRAKAELTG